MPRSRQKKRWDALPRCGGLWEGRRIRTMTFAASKQHVVSQLELKETQPCKAELVEASCLASSYAGSSTCSGHIHGHLCGNPLASLQLLVALTARSDKPNKSLVMRIWMLTVLY